MEKFMKRILISLLIMSALLIIDIVTSLVLIYQVNNLNNKSDIISTKVKFIAKKSKKIYDKTDSIFTDGHQVLTENIPMLMYEMSFMKGIETGKSQEKLSRVESYIELNSPKQ